MAAIAAVHAQAPSWQETDWREIVAVYDVLIDLWASAVVALNRAVALGLAEGPQAGLHALDSLGDEPQLAGYSHFAAARADFLRRLGRSTEARTAYEEALMLTKNAVERQFLEDRIAAQPGTRQRAGLVSGVLASTLARNLSLSMGRDELGPSSP